MSPENKKKKTLVSMQGYTQKSSMNASHIIR